MRLALLSDIHGNAMALDRCLERVRALAVDAVYFLGDAVGYLPAARQVLQSLEVNGIACQQGNHERMLLSGAVQPPEREDTYRLAQARQQLGPDQLRRVASWPLFRRLRCGKHSLLLVHGSPRAPLDGYVYPDTDLAPLHDLAADAVVMGHTHRPFVRSSGGKVFVNVGSVGLPRDQGSLASFALYDDRTHRFDIIRVALDVEPILAAYGDQVAESVRGCLRRTGNAPPAPQKG